MNNGECCSWYSLEMEEGAAAGRKAGRISRDG